MSIVARPDRWMTADDIMGRIDGPSEMTGDLKPLLQTELGECMLPCRVVNPHSLEGRIVYVYFSQRDVTEVLLSLREVARDARSTSLGGADG